MAIKLPNVLFLAPINYKVHLSYTLIVVFQDLGISSKVRTKLLEVLLSILK